MENKFFWLQKSILYRIQNQYVRACGVSKNIIMNTGTFDFGDVFIMGPM